MRAYPDVVMRRKGVVFGHLSRQKPSTVEAAVEVLQASYPQFQEHHFDLASEWRETVGKAKRKQPRKTAAPQARPRGRPRDVDRVVGGLNAKALKVVTGTFSSTAEFLSAQEAIAQLGGSRKVVALFKLFGR